MTYRDENDALDARITALKDAIKRASDDQRELRGELARAETLRGAVDERTAALRDEWMLILGACSFLAAIVVAGAKLTHAPFDSRAVVIAISCALCTILTGNWDARSRTP